MLSYWRCACKISTSCAVRNKIDAQLTQDSKWRVDTKTPKSRQALPLPAVVVDALAAHIAEYPPAEDETIFTTAQGNRYRQEHYQARIFRPAVRAAGLPDDTTPHHLRHHFASVMLRATGDAASVARAMGNTPAMVSDIRALYRAARIACGAQSTPRGLTTMHPQASH